MSLPNYLANIKSSGIYRFVFDKSQVPPQVAETLRLVIGYSEKGPFNTPVYIDNKADFINVFGNINKRLEKRGVFFHRMALQALSAGPILALNVKPFNDENVSYIAVSGTDSAATISSDLKVTNLYNTKRFWKLDENDLPTVCGGTKYYNIAATDVKDASCTIFIRPVKPKSYHITIADYFNQILHEEIPEYLESKVGEYLDNYFAEIYVFKGEFTESLCTGEGPLAKYFEQPAVAAKSQKASTPASASTATPSTKSATVASDSPFVAKLVEKSPSQLFDNTLDALAADPNSRFIGKYSGCTLPYMKDANGYYMSLDILFNRDHDTHKMIMKFNDELLDSGSVDTLVSLGKFADGLTAYYIPGYTYTSITKVAKAKDIQDNVFKELAADKGLFEALTNNVDVYYHYIIDTFESLVELDCKAVLSRIAKAKGNAFALLNFPAIKTFEQNGLKDIKDLLSSQYPFSLPTEPDGASFCAFYTPLVFADGALKVTVPSAALVSNNFMDKYTSRLPYYIVAGPNYGRMNYTGLIGPDYNFSRKDLDVLEPYGVNAMVYVPRKGTFINSNQTAKQVPVSALSKVHVRELVIYLQDEIEKMMQNYQWELNTQVLRDNIKAKADTILEVVKNNKGIFDYINVCDSSNNTPEVIDNEMIILDTAIEPARGAGKMVQQLTIHKTGGISTLLK